MHIRSRAELPLTYHLRFTATDDKSTVYVFTDTGRIGRRTEVHRDLTINSLTNLLVSLRHRLCGMGVSNIATFGCAASFRRIGIAVSASRQELFGSRSSLKSAGTTAVTAATCATISHQGRGLILETGITVFDSIRSFRSPVFR